MAEYNPRKISDEAMNKLEHSLNIHGQVENLVYNIRTDTLVSGHQRLIAARNLGWTHVDVLEIDIPESQEKALNVALNNPNIMGEFDLPKLQDVLDIIIEAPDIQIEDTGFTIDDYEKIKINIHGDPDKEQKEYDENIETENKCPKCGYEW